MIIFKKNVPTEFLVIFASGVSSYGNAKAEIILVKMSQGVKNIKNQVSTQRSYLEERKGWGIDHSLVARNTLLGIWKDRMNTWPPFTDWKRADRHVGWGRETKNTWVVFLYLIQTFRSVSKCPTHLFVGRFLMSYLCVL